MFSHCKIKFRHKDIWFLFDNKDFKDRCLYIFKCPVCKKQINVLHETRKADGKRFTDITIGQKAEAFRKQISYQVNYTFKTLNIKYGTKSNMNWKYQKNGLIYDLNNTLIGKALRLKELQKV